MKKKQFVVRIITSHNILSQNTVCTGYHHGRKSQGDVGDNVPTKIGQWGIPSIFSSNCLLETGYIYMKLYIATKCCIAYEAAVP